MFKLLNKNEMSKQKSLFFKGLVSLFSLAVLFLFANPQIRAVSNPFSSGESSASSGDSDLVLLATVNFTQGKIVSQNGNDFEISFTVSNREKVQPEVRYSVNLLPAGNMRSSYIHSYVYPVYLSLRENESLNERIIYKAPELLDGKFQMMLVAQNKDGLALASFDLGEVTLKGNGGFIKLGDDNCKLSVTGDTREYNLVQGVDIKPEETLNISCEVQNSGDSLSIRPSFLTFKYTEFGEEVKIPESNFTAQDVLKNKKTILSFAIPKPKEPQAYHTKMVLIDTKTGKEVSNQIFVHYVLKGLSASIVNLRLDKDYYFKGETAEISLFWGDSADSFRNSRFQGTELKKPIVQISITDEKGNNCISPIEEKLNQSGPVVFTEKVKIDCNNPRLKAEILDDKKVLVSKNLEIDSIKNKKRIPPKSSKSIRGIIDETSSSQSTVALVIVALILVLALVAFYIKNRSNSAIKPRGRGLRLLVFGLISGLLSLMWVDGVKADTYYIKDRDGTLHTSDYFTINFSPASLATSSQASPSHLTDLAAGGKMKIDIGAMVYGGSCRNITAWIDGYLFHDADRTQIVNFKAFREDTPISDCNTHTYGFSVNWNYDYFVGNDADVLHREPIQKTFYYNKCVSTGLMCKVFKDKETSFSQGDQGGICGTLGSTGSTVSCKIYPVSHSFTYDKRDLCGNGFIPFYINPGNENLFETELEKTDNAGTLKWKCQSNTNSSLSVDCCLTKLASFTGPACGSVPGNCSAGSFVDGSATYIPDSANWTTATWRCQKDSTTVSCSASKNPPGTREQGSIRVIETR